MYSRLFHGLTTYNHMLWRSSSRPQHKHACKDKQPRLQLYNVVLSYILIIKPLNYFSKFYLSCIIWLTENTTAAHWSALCSFIFSSITPSAISLPKPINSVHCVNYYIIYTKGVIPYLHHRVHPIAEEACPCTAQLLSSGEDHHESVQWIRGWATKRS